MDSSRARTLLAARMDSLVLVVGSWLDASVVEEWLMLAYPRRPVTERRSRFPSSTDSHSRSLPKV